MELGSVLEAVAVIRVAYDQLAELPVDGLTHPELLEVLGELEALTRRLPAQSHRILARLQREASPVELGAKSWRDVVSGRLLISGKDAKRRLEEALELGPRTTFSGQAQAPLLAKTAAAQAAGSIGAEHVGILRGSSSSCRVGSITRPGSSARPRWCGSRSVWVLRSWARPRRGWRC
jgi:hypothetical protein